MSVINRFTSRTLQVTFLLFGYMLLISKDMSDINATKHMLASKFDMKDLEVEDLIRN